MEAETQGKVKVTYFPAGQLVSDKDGLEKIGSGVADMGMINPEYYQGQLPLIGVGGLPFLFTNAKHGTKVMAETRDFFTPELETNKIKLLWAFTPPPYVPILGKKPIHKLEDWKGLRLRSVGSTQAEGVKALGAVPVVIFAGEMYAALQRGTIDGLVFPVSAASSFKLQEIAQNVTFYGVNTIPLLLCMNLEKWNSLSKEIQDKIMLASKTAMEKTGILYDNWETETLAKWEKVGIKIYNPPASELSLWKKATEAVWNSWISENEKMGLPAKKLAEEVKSRAEKSR
jgi:TRAP-type C4-dicarboxylate transport system substrate-binding protein